MNVNVAWKFSPLGELYLDHGTVLCSWLEYQVKCYIFCPPVALWGLENSSPPHGISLSWIRRLIHGPGAERGHGSGCDLFLCDPTRVEL